MKKTMLFTTVFVLIALSLAAFSPQSVQDLFRKALAKERAEGNLDEAIAIYQKIANESTDESLAANAQLRIGICYEKLGKTEALKAYQTVIERFPNQSEQVAEARARMSELKAPEKVAQSLSKIYSRGEDGYLLENKSLSPDGTKLLGINIGEGPGQNVAYKDLVTGNLVYITYFDWESEGHGYTYNAVWSPDGKQVAFTFKGWKDPLKEVWISDLKGNSKSIFQCEKQGDIIGPVEWFPGGREILAVQVIQKKFVQLGILSIDDGTFRLLYEIDRPKNTRVNEYVGKYFKTDLSPDGKHVVFEERKEEISNLYVLDIAGKRIKPLMDSVTNDFNPCWSPDGKHIAFQSDRSGNHAVWAIPINQDGDPAGQPFFLREGRDTGLINWTFEGLCFSSGMNMVDVFIMPVDPQSGEPVGKPRQLDFRPTGKNTYPVWSPDGSQLVFFSNLNDKWGELYVVIYPMTGVEVRKFKAPSTRGDRIVPRVADLRWLPDGSGISYSGNDPSTPRGSNDFINFKMYVLKLDSGKWETHDLNLDANTSHTDWRGDGNAFYYSRYPQGQKNFKYPCGIVERDLSTGDERYVYRPEKNAGFPSIRCSRDFTKFSIGSLKLSISNPGRSSKNLTIPDFQLHRHGRRMEKRS
jgi:Tol biopolymer transport system component